MAQQVKNATCNAGNTGDAGLIPGSGRSLWRRKWQPAPVFLLGKPHRHRSLAGYCPKCCKGSAMSKHSGKSPYLNSSQVQDFSTLTLPQPPCRFSGGYKKKETWQRQNLQLDRDLENEGEAKNVLVEGHHLADGQLWELNSFINQGVTKLLGCTIFSCPPGNFTPPSPTTPVAVALSHLIVTWIFSFWSLFGELNYASKKDVY